HGAHTRGRPHLGHHLVLRAQFLPPVRAATNPRRLVVSSIDARHRPPRAQEPTVPLADHPFHGPIHHLGYVCDDLAATVQHLVSVFAPRPSEVLQLTRLDPEPVRRRSRNRRRTCTTRRMWWPRSMSARRARISSAVGSPRSCTRPWASST